MAAKKKAAKASKEPKKTKAPGLAKATLPSPPEAPPQHHVKIASQQYEMRAVTSIQPHPKNPRKGNMQAIGESLEANDFYGAAIVQKSTNLILVGNHRVKMAIEKGLSEVPVIVIDVDDATAERIMLADNRIPDLANYDNRALLALAEDRAKAGDLAGTGFADADLAKMRDKVSPPVQFPEYDGQVHVSYKCPACSYEWT